MTLRRYIILIGCMLLSVLTPALALSREVGRITKTEGGVNILRAGQSAAEAVKVEDTVSIGDILRTKSDGSAEITFIDKSVMKVGPRSRLGVDEYLFKPDEGKRSASLKLFRGKAGFNIWKANFPAEGNKFEMKTRTAIAGVRGTEGILYTDGVERVYVKEGKIEFSNPLGSVMVTAGRVGEVLSGMAPVERAYRESEYNRYDEGITPKAIKESEERSKGGKEAEEPGAKGEKVEKRHRPDEERRLREEVFKGVEGESHFKEAGHEQGDLHDVDESSSIHDMEEDRTTSLPITDVEKPKTTAVDVNVTFP